MNARPKLSALVLTVLVLINQGCSESPDRLLAKAREAIDRKEVKAAEIHLKNLLQVQERPDARYLLAQLHAGNGDMRSAEKEFQRAFDGGHDRTQSGIGLAEAHLSLGAADKALDLAKSLYPGQPIDVARVQTVIGRAWLTTGKSAEAEQAFRLAIAAFADHAPAQVGLIALTAAKDLAAASEQIDELLARLPDSTEAMALKGDLEFAKGNPARAATLFAAVASREPQNRHVRMKLASIASDAKDFAGAQQWIDSLKKLTGPAVLTMHLQALNEFRQGMNEAARDSILVGLKHAPGHLPSLALAASIFLSLNSLEQAEANARSVIEKAPRSTLGYRLLGATYLRMNTPDRALQTVSQPIERGAKDPLLFGIAGEAALRLNEADKAAGYFSKAAELAPDDPAQKAGRGLARIAAGDKEGGLLDLEAAAELTPLGISADLALVTQRMRDKDWDKALSAIERIERKQPKNPMVSNLRGAVSLGKADLGAARKQFEAALALDPVFFAAVANLANLDLRERKPDDAGKRYLGLLAKDPRNVRAMLAMANLAQSAEGDRKKAHDWLRKARETDRDSVPAIMALARFHLSGSDPKEALPGLQEAVAAAPDRIELLDALGVAYLAAGDKAQAISSFDKMIRLRPESAPVHQRVGEFYLGQGDPERALKHLRKAVELAPGAIESRLMLASALGSSGALTEARAIASALQRDARTAATGAELDGDVLLQARKFGEAAGAYRKALSIQKGLPLAQKLHRSLVANGQNSEAQALLKALIAENPGDLRAKGYAAMWEISQKRWAQAIILYREILAVQSDDALALNNLAWALHELRDPEALSAAEKAYALAPRSSAVLDTYGAILLAQGQTAKAADVLRQAVTAAPKTPMFRVRLADALITRGDKADARKELDIVLASVKSGPLMEQAQALMRKL